LPYWAGVVPQRATYETPIVDTHVKADAPLPASVEALLKHGVARA
jgi:hypothetical protein